MEEVNVVTMHVGDVPVECPYHAEHGHRFGREIETISYTCGKGGVLRHVSPWTDCESCPENAKRRS